MASVHWNFFPPGDVVMDSLASASFVQHGRLLEFSTNEDITGKMPMELPAIADGQPLLFHGPAWPFVGAVVTVLRGADGTPNNAFLSLRLAAFLSGMCVLLLAFLIGRRMFSLWGAIVVTSWMAFSYVLIDYSGNGSLYMLQTAFYLLWILVALQKLRPMRALLLGIISGAAYLVNFQSMILVPSALLLFFMEQGNKKQRLYDAFVFLSASALVVAPWLIRMWYFYGDPLASHHLQQTYIYIKAGVTPTVVDGVSDFHVGLREWLSIIAGMIRVWLPNNLYYAARKLFILAPFAFFLFSFGAIDAIFSREKFRRVAPLLIVLLFHLLISSVWPVMKFRHLVPSLALVLLLGMEHLESLPIRPRLRMFCMGFVTLAIVTFSFLAYREIPTHTFYYDGALTTDAYHGSQQMKMLQDLGYLTLQ